MLQELWGHSVIRHCPDAFSPSRPDTPLLLSGLECGCTQFPCQPCAYSGEGFPSSRLWTDAEVPAEQTAEGVSLSHPHQVLHLQQDQVREDLQSNPRVAIIFPLGYTSSHQGKHLCCFCPKSSCWAHYRRAVISEATLQRAPASFYKEP